MRVASTFIVLGLVGACTSTSDEVVQERSPNTPAAQPRAPASSSGGAHGETDAQAPIPPTPPPSASEDDAGGTLPAPPPTYVLTEVTDYVEPSHVDGETRPYGRDTFTVHGGVIDDVFDFPDGDTARFTAMLMENGSELHMTTSCTWSRVQNA